MSIDDEWQSGVVPRNDAAQPMTHGDGYFIVPQVGRILYATSPDGPWSIEDLPIGEVTVFHVIYGDGNWVAATGDGILTAASPAGPWTMRYDTSGASEVLAYGADKWVAAGPGILLTAIDPTGTWTENTSDDFGSPRWLAYGDGTFVLVGLNGALFYTTTPAGSWTDASSGTTDYHAIAYGNGDWILAGGTDGFVGSAVAKTATSPGGSWTTITTGSAASAFSIGGVSYLDGAWVLLGYAEDELRFAPEPSGPWEPVELPGSVTSRAATVYNDGEWGVNLGSEVGFQTGAGDGWGVILT